MSGKNIAIIAVAVAVVVLLIWWNASQPTGSPRTGTPTSPAAPATSAPGGTRPPEETQQDEFFTSAVARAQDGTSIDVTECANNPPVLRIKLGAQLTFRNNGSNEVVIDLAGVKRLPGDDELTVEAGFGRGTGLFGYGCNTADKGNSGLILVTE